MALLHSASDFPLLDNLDVEAVEIGLCFFFGGKVFTLKLKLVELSYMANNSNYASKMLMNNMVMGVVIACLNSFVYQIIRHVRSGGHLDDDAIAELKLICIRDAKDTSVKGIPIDQEADTLNKAVALLEMLLDDAIEEGKLDS